MTVPPALRTQNRSPATRADRDTGPTWKPTETSVTPIRGAQALPISTQSVAGLKNAASGS